ncbi:hypothetical protein LXL04_008579 [Taraxacum kok-saghyz]
MRNNGSKPPCMSKKGPLYIDFSDSSCPRNGDPPLNKIREGPINETFKDLFQGQEHGNQRHSDHNILKLNNLRGCLLMCRTKDSDSDHGLGPWSVRLIMSVGLVPRIRSDLLPRTRSAQKNRRLRNKPLMSDSVRGPRRLIGEFDVGLVSVNTWNFGRELQPNDLNIKDLLDTDYPADIYFSRDNTFKYWKHIWI